MCVLRVGGREEAEKFRGGTMGLLGPEECGKVVGTKGGQLTGRAGGVFAESAETGSEGDKEEEGELKEETEEAEKFRDEIMESLGPWEREKTVGAQGGRLGRCVECVFAESAESEEAGLEVGGEVGTVNVAW